MIDRQDIFKHWEDKDAELRFKEIAKGYGLSQHIELQKKETLVGLYERMTGQENLEHEYKLRFDQEKADFDSKR